MSIISLCIKNFVTKKDFLKIINKKKFENHFFPLPIYFGVSKEIFDHLSQDTIFFEVKNS